MNSEYEYNVIKHSHCGIVHYIVHLLHVLITVILLYLSMLWCYVKVLIALAVILINFVLVDIYSIQLNQLYDNVILAVSWIRSLIILTLH